MYQVNIVEGPTALSTMLATVDYPWYLHSIVPLSETKFMLVLGYRKGKDEVQANAKPADPDAWRRW
jgi:hypothetical protein